MSGLVALAAGLLFGVGLTLSGMTDPRKVQNFLDFSGTWDPSLALVMAGAVGVTAIAHQLSRRMRAPLLAERFPQPPRQVDARLLLGAGCFGVGWGLVGLCPGPALANLARPNGSLLVFVAAMLAGMALFRLQARTTAARSTRSASELGSRSVS